MFVKKILPISIISLLFAQMVYVLVAEPAIATAATASDQVVVTLNVTSGITISDGANISMPALGVGINGSTGSSSWIVKTNNVTGYNLAVKASASPALVSGVNSFADYTEATNGTPEAWSVPSGSKEFGYSAYGSTTPTATWGTAASCGTATTPSATQLYVGFETTDKVIAQSATVTPTAGVTTTLCVAAEQDGVYAPSGTYTATLTATATTL